MWISGFFYSILFTLALLATGCSNVQQTAAFDDFETISEAEYAEAQLLAKNMELRSKSFKVLPSQGARAVMPSRDASYPPMEFLQNATYGVGDERNVWDRLRMGYAFPSVDNYRIQEQIAHFERNAGYIDRAAVRAQPYIYFIVEELERRGMPLELALLPIIESAYRTQAQSHAAASGIWQFIPSTGRLYGLTQNSWYDGRQDFHASTMAALDYLSYLHGYFDGDWFKALAAYNAGEGRVGRAVRANQQAGKPTDYWSLNLPRETQDYVPRLLAVARMVKYPERYQVSLPYVPNRPYFARVAVSHALDLQKVSQQAGMPWDDFLALNAGFKRGVKPEGTHYIHLPQDRLHKVNFHLARTDAPAIAQLASAPVVQPRENKPAVRLVSSSSTTLTPSPRITTSTPTLSYKVRPGDTLFSIANRFDTSTTELRRLNNMKNSDVYTGAILKVPVPARNGVLAVGKPRQQTITKITHKVLPGETMTGIARKYDVEVAEVALWNKVKVNYIVKTGERLTIYKR
jgi:membrane-bound lytic murein transglycosylase D